MMKKPNEFQRRCRRGLAMGLVLLFGSPIMAETLDLTGQWNFAIDPSERGDAQHWFAPKENWDRSKSHPAVGWDVVTVPHDYLADPRYHFTGPAWYRRSIAVPKDAGEARRWRLEFDTVFQRCRIWINGKFVGAHEGGYTPFAFDVSAQLEPGRQNYIVVAVDNRVKARALPGARSGETIQSGQFPWLNYGGILGGARLVAHEPLWICGQKIETKLQADGSAQVQVRIAVRNDGRESLKAQMRTQIVDKRGAELPLALSGTLTVPVGTTGTAVLSGTLPQGTYQLWEIDAPRLYQSRATVVTGNDVATQTTNFGFRSLEMRDARFLLNGKVVRLAGANRARGHPVYGGIDPDALVEQDMQLMKDAGLRFARLQHTAPGKNLLEWADRHGMLLILEVGMWGYTEPDLASEELRSRFHAEMKEMMELAWNHPSVVGWSLGNEYESWTSAGVDWTRDMAAFVKKLDPTRPVTFAALGGELRRLRDEKIAGPRAFDHVDFISTNIYFPVREVPAYLDLVHARWPGKPVLITEYGLRADRVKNEQERIEHFDAMLVIVTERPWVCGLSYWSFNDYASRYPGTGEDGYRRWGLVDEFRQPRPLYQHMREKLRNGF